jgi:hypothetical protein
MLSSMQRIRLLLRGIVIVLENLLWEGHIIKVHATMRTPPKGCKAIFERHGGYARRRFECLLYV